MKHLVFIGRWSPLHRGHQYIIKTIYEEKQQPVLILVRDSEETIPLSTRISIIQNWLYSEGIPGIVMMIPDISGVYYGRGVGYEIREVIVPESIKTISGTDTRKAIDSDKLNEVYSKVINEKLPLEEKLIRERLKKLGYIE